MKTCTKCRASKTLDEFYSHKRSKDGKSWACKSCTKDARKAVYERDKDRDLARKKRWRERKGAPNRRRYFSSVTAMPRLREGATEDEKKEHLREYRKLYYQANQDRLKKKAKAYRKANRERGAVAKKRWRQGNRPSVALRSILSSFLARAKMGKTGLTHEVLGYTGEQLRQRMECQFESGMSWDNHGEWHVDHRIPISRFIKRNETRPHIVNALSNLQPMWASDNISKRDRWVG